MFYNKHLLSSTILNLFDKQKSLIVKSLLANVWFMQYKIFLFPSGKAI